MDEPEYLDHLIEQHLLRGKRFSSIDEGLAPVLSAAKLLVQLQTVALPPEFASRLEASLRARIHNLRRP